MPAKSRSNCADLGRRGTNHIMDTWIFIWYLFLPLLKNTRIFAVLAEKCRSWKKMPLWEIVRARGRVFSPFGRVLSPFGRAFSPQKNGFGINISEEILVCPKRSFLCKTYLLSKRQKLSPFWRGRYVIYDWERFSDWERSSDIYPSNPIQPNVI